MTCPPEPPQTEPSGPQTPQRPSADRSDRSAAALRANLARRKAQARERADTPADDIAGTSADDNEEDRPCP